MNIEAAKKLDDLWLQLDQATSVTDVLLTVHGQNVEHDPLEGTRKGTRASLFYMLDSQLRSIQMEIEAVADQLRGKQGGAA